MPTFFTDIDNVQTAAILTLVFTVAIAALRGDRRFSQQHRDLQDVILSQHEILSLMSKHEKQIVNCQMQIDGIKRAIAAKAHENLPGHT